MTDYTAFSQRLNQFKTLSIKLKDAINEGIRTNRFEANETFISPGNFPGSIYYIYSGIVRGAVEGPTEKTTTWFKKEGDIIIPQGMLTQQASDEYVTCVVNTMVLSLSFTHLQRLINGFAETNELLLLLLNEKIREGNYRENMLRIQAAKDRYQLLLEHEDYILKRVPQYLVASYLNVTKETFSRLNKGLPY